MNEISEEEQELEVVSADDDDVLGGEEDRDDDDDDDDDGGDNDHFLYNNNFGNDDDDDEEEEEDTTILRLSSSNVIDFHTLARNLRSIESGTVIDILSLYRLHLDYNEAFEVIEQLHKFNQLHMDDCCGNSVYLIIDHLFQNNKNIERLEYVYSQEDEENDNDDVGDENNGNSINANVISSLCNGLHTTSHGLKELCLRISMTESITNSLFFHGINHSMAEENWEHVPFLQSLDLSQCDFDATSASVKVLCDGLKENCGLVKLKLENCRLEDDEIADIIFSLTAHPTLKELSVALNYAGSNTIEAVSKLLMTQRNDKPRDADNLHGLERLDLGQQSPGHLRNLELVYKALAINNTLKSLCLRENYLLKSQIPHLIDALQINSTLEELNLEDCDLRQEGVELVIHGIHQYHSLRKLWLRNNVTPQQRDTIDLSDMLPGQLEANHVIQLLDVDEEWISKSEQRLMVDYYLLLNRAGRQFMKCSTTNDKLPLGMWPILLERIDKCLFRRKEQRGDNFSSNTSNDTASQRQRVENFGGLCLHSTIYFMLHGPALSQR